MILQGDVEIRTNTSHQWCWNCYYPRAIHGVTHYYYLNSAGRSKSFSASSDNELVLDGCQVRAQPCGSSTEEFSLPFARPAGGPATARRNRGDGVYFFSPQIFLLR